ncbi:hypothetical protein F5879DRAFT_993825 [Lentinula edodes]|nr:hypothetical protein F5879DRAFT_993825 [Lentinula edodes]
MSSSYYPLDKHIINTYIPPPLDVHRDIPLKFREFIRELDQLRSQRLPSDLKEFDCAVAANWKRLWPWMKRLLEANRVFEHNRHPSAEFIDRAFFCVKAVLSVLTQIFSFSSSVRVTQSSLACKIFDSSDFAELLPLAWAVAVIHPMHQDYVDEVMQMLDGTNFLDLVDSNRLEHVARQLEACCTKITDKSLAHWIHIANLDCLQFNHDLSLVNGPQTYLLLQLVNEVPGNSFHLYLKQADTAMTLLNHLTKHLTNPSVSILGSALYSPSQIRIKCINAVLRCYKIWLAGGARWVAAVLNHHLIFMMVKIRDFLEGLRDNDLGCENATRATLATICELFQCIRRYKPYFAVSHRIKLNLDLCEKRISQKSLRSTLVRFRESPSDIALRNEWQLLQLEFYVKDALILRRASWDCARLSHCSFDQCPNKLRPVSLNIIPPRICSRCRSFAYCGVECQSRHHEHKLQCSQIANALNKHPLYAETLEFVIASVEISYIQCLLCAAAQKFEKEMPPFTTKLSPEEFNSGSLAVIVDLSQHGFGNCEVKLQDDVYEEVDDEGRVILSKGLAAVFCGLVPAFGSKHTLFVFKNREVHLENGDVVGIEELFLSALFPLLSAVWCFGRLPALMKRDPAIYLPGDVFIYVLQLVQNSPTSHWSWQVLVLASVCRCWRNFTIGAPMLWRHIAAPAYGLHFITLLLERSQRCSLVIEYQTATPDNRVLSLLAEHSERWEDVLLCIPPSSYTCLSSLKGRLPLLKHLALHATVGDSEAYAYPLSRFENAPVLQLLDLRWFHDDLVQEVSVPWTQLTHLCGQSIKLTSLHSLLDNAPMLSTLCVSEISHNSHPSDRSKLEILTRMKLLSVIDCEIRVVYSLLHRALNLVELDLVMNSDPGKANTDIPIILPHLHTLKIRINGIFPSLVNFLVFEAPRLSDIKFSGCYCLDNSDDELENRFEEVATSGSLFLQFLRNFVQGSGCNLVSLTLDCEVDFHASDMMPLLEVLPSLENLDISVLHMGCIPFRGMTPASAKLPKLQTFYLRIPPEECLMDDLNDLISLATSNSILKVQLVAK